MLPLLFISLTSKGRGTRQIIHVFGYEETEAKVSCSYDEGYESYEKYLCKNYCSSDDVLITTTEAHKNRYSISDDTNKQVFTATISNLNQNDAGKYWCGVTRSGKDYYPAEVELKVEKDTCCDNSSKVQSYEGGSVSISCSYESQDQNNMKYICRGNQPSSCLQQALITSNNRRNTQFSLTDDKVSRKFTVTTTSLTQKDSGSYLCGIHRNTGLDVFSAVDLEFRGERSQFKGKRDELKQDLFTVNYTKQGTKGGGGGGVNRHYKSRQKTRRQSNNIKLPVRRGTK
uniref:Ig-like domain-containing protein n=1 Tax=Anabas testudineus TaxID=64144 RepID=A0A3Q1J2I1_ANATE